MSFPKVTILLGFLLICGCFCKPTRDCEKGVLPQVQVIGPDGVCFESPCVVRPGKEIYFNLTFNAPQYMDNFRPEAIAHTIFDFPISLDQEDGCRGIVNTPCPVVIHEKIQYEFSFKIFEIIPTMEFDVTFSLLDTDNNDEPIVCFNVLLSVLQNGVK